MKYNYSYEYRDGRRVESQVSIPYPSGKDFEDLAKRLSFVRQQKNPKFEILNI